MEERTVLSRDTASLKVQIAAVKKELSAAKRSWSAAYSRSMSGYRRRRPVPGENRLRSSRFDQACELQKQAEEELRYLYRARAIAMSPFEIYVQILVVPIAEPSRANRYLIVDIEPRGWSGYCYRVQELTKKGTLWERRFGGWVHPNSMIRIELCTLPLAPDVVSFCEYARQNEERERDTRIGRPKPG